jgi:two-component system, LytTR family, sensor kinase
MRAAQRMPRVPSDLRSLRVWLVVFGLWTSVAVVTATVRRTFYPSENLGWSESFLLSLCDEWTSALATPPLLWLGFRWRVDRASWRWNVPKLAAACATFALVEWLVSNAATHAIASTFDLEQWKWPVAVTEFLGGYLLCVLVTCQIVLLSQGFLYYRESNLRAVREVEEREQRTVAQLQALRGQLRPHFLFNTLHAVQTLMQTDPARAERAITLLGDLLRRSLADDGQQAVALEAELDFALRYLEIEKVRLGSRLEVEVDVPEECRWARVPSFVLHPLVENAIRHGVARSAGPGRVAIRARRAGQRLELAVEDNGPGFERAAPTSGTGIGLANTRARLALLHGDQADLRVERTGGTTSVRVELPWSVSGHAARLASVP